MRGKNTVAGVIKANVDSKMPGSRQQRFSLKARLIFAVAPRMMLGHF
jgi:hypothetical protein